MHGASDTDPPALSAAEADFLRRPGMTGIAWPGGPESVLAARCGIVFTIVALGAFRTPLTPAGESARLASPRGYRIAAIRARLILEFCLPTVRANGAQAGWRHSMVTTELLALPAGFQLMRVWHD